jgi:hypothetical protein
MANDKPSINMSLASLEAEIGTPEPYVLALKSGKRITFPDLFDIPIDESEEFLSDLQKSGQNDLGFLEKWLSKADFEAYKAAKVPLRVHAALIQRVLAYYQQTVGTPGE